jgi:DNA polymerase-3 subunit gamma/tau
MNLTLYRKYRPSFFSDVVGQDHVTIPLSNALNSKNIHHAYLFSGPRGCGKTSSARIMARSLNCEKGPTPNPCGECQSCKDLVANGPGSIDVIEIDAATHGLVDDARDLRDKAFFAPANSRYKIYIIDEAHQLGPGAANALLKVVEEPPPHVLFIFATTEPDKLISTIRSRTHHYPFRLVSPNILASHLEKICESEKVKVDKGVIPLVIKASGGSVRDALSILGQILAGADKDGVNYELAAGLLGFTNSNLINQTVDAISAKDLGNLFQLINQIIESGQDARRFTQDLLDRFREMLIAASSEDAGNILDELSTEQLEVINKQSKNFSKAELVRISDVIAQGLNQMRGSTVPRLVLELICAKILINSIENSAKATPQNTSIKKVNTEVSVAPHPTNKSNLKVVQDLSATALEKHWPEVIENVKQKRRLTWSLLSASARILSVDDTTITIAVSNSGAKDSFIRSASDAILSQAFQEVVGVTKKIEIQVDSAKDLVVSEFVEDSESKPQLSAEELLAKELGAKVIKE